MEADHSEYSSIRRPLLLQFPWDAPSTTDVLSPINYHLLA